jgi:predicted MFS family arabinose efflux permease
MRIASVVVLGIAGLVVNTLPAITGVLARQLGFGVGMLGAFASASYLSSAVGSFLAIVVMRYASPRATVTMGLCFLLASNLGSAVLGWAGALVALSALGGLGTGITFGACYYVYGLEHQERNTAASLLGQTASAAVMITAIPVMVHVFGWRAMFVGFGVLVVPCLILARYFPSGYKQEEAPELSTKPTASGGILWLGLMSVAMFSIGMLAMWTYLERIGAVAGISEQAIARSLSVCTIFGFLSSAIVVALGERITWTIPLVICVILNILGAAAIGSSVAWIYMTAVSVFYFSLPIYLSAQFGAIMRKAPSTRFAVRYNLALAAGSFGPSIGGLVASQYGFASVRWLTISFTLVAAIMLWIGFFSRRRSGALEAVIE